MTNDYKTALDLAGQESKQIYSWLQSKISQHSDEPRAERDFNILKYIREGNVSKAAAILIDNHEEQPDSIYSPKVQMYKAILDIVRDEQ
jgi:hypothetical protein